MRGLGLLAAGCVLCAAVAAPVAAGAGESVEVTAPPEQPAATMESGAVESGGDVESYGEVEAVGEVAATEPEAGAAATKHVDMRDIKFKPKKITIKPGDTVEWRNEDEAKHDAIGENGKFDTPVISKGETSSHTFDKAGNYPYFCSIHVGMDGKITVSSSSGGGGGGGGGSTGNGTGGVSVGGSDSTSSSGSSGGSSFSSTGSSSSSSLPSTGEDVLWLFAIGAALLWLGAASGVIVLAQRRERERTGR